MKVLSYAALISLFIAQVSIAATYTPPDGTNSGSLQLDNILLDTGGNLSVTLIATDQSTLHGGQIYGLTKEQLGTASGEQDGDYYSIMQRIMSKKVVESTTLTHQVTLKYSGAENEKFLYKVIGLNSTTYTKDNQILKQNI